MQKLFRPNYYIIVYNDFRAYYSRQENKILLLNITSKQGNLMRAQDGRGTSDKKVKYGTLTGFFNKTRR